MFPFLFSGRGGASSTQSQLSTTFSTDGRSVTYQLGAKRSLSLGYSAGSVFVDYETPSIRLHSRMGKDGLNGINNVYFVTDAEGKIIYPFKYPRGSEESKELSHAERSIIEDILMGRGAGNLEEAKEARTRSTSSAGGSSQQSPKAYLAQSYTKEGYATAIYKREAETIQLTWSSKDSKTTLEVQRPNDADTKYVFGKNKQYAIPNPKFHKWRVGTDSQGRMIEPWTFTLPGTTEEGVSAAHYPASPSNASANRPETSSTHSQQSFSGDRSGEPEDYADLFERLAKGGR